MGGAPLGVLLGIPCCFLDDSEDLGLVELYTLENIEGKRVEGVFASSTL